MIVPGYDVRATLRHGPAWTLLRAVRGRDGAPVLLKHAAAGGPPDATGAVAA
jgi:hypothetical protein